MKKIIFTLAILGFVLVSCNKEKKAMKRLEGNWNVTAMSLDSSGVSIDYWAQYQAMGITSINMNFENCGTDAACNLYTTTTGSFMGIGFSESDTATYEVSEDGESITIDTDAGTTEELTKESLIISTIDGNTTMTVTLAKTE